MCSNSDLTFLTNEEGQTLRARFNALIKDTKYFDVLVGYFYTSGFHAIYKSLETTKKIRVLIGINTDASVLNLVEQASQKELSDNETKKHFTEVLINEMDTAKDSKAVEEGVLKFIEWLKNGKLEVKAYPSRNIHAKLYIMSFEENDRDKGRIITGSSNFTQSGLVDNLEFNVELKNRSDYEFAKVKFEELWKDAVDVKDKYIETIQEKTWLSEGITPYQLYLKFLYEYFKDDLRQTEEVKFKYVPNNFMQLEYQEQAVLNAKKILNEYGGVFISDVVGLGKTYISAMLASELDGLNLVLAPPVLLDENNPGSWSNVFQDFKQQVKCESIGKLDQLISQGTEKYKNIFIDEAHRFRTESNSTYEKLAQICKGKRVILITATPFNNSPMDILAQIKLFQPAKNSNIPNRKNLEYFFKSLDKKINKLDRQKDRDEYLRTAQENSKEVREKVLKHIMVRRTRREVEEYFKEDLEKQNLKFPEVLNPEPVFYQLNKEENEVFQKTIELITTDFKYARYMPMLYYKGESKLDQLEQQSQKNMGRFMKILLIKRLESSFHAFRKTVDRFISYYDQFLKEFKNGSVYVSKKYANKVFELLDNDGEETIEKLLQDSKAQKYPSEDFSENLKYDLENDLEILRKIQKLWFGVKRDPKLMSFIEILSSRHELKNNKLIVFTESKETAEYLYLMLDREIPDQVIMFNGSSSVIERQKVIENFDARANYQKDDFRILVTTEVLSEGVNLHLSNVVINYDIPWNPTRLMQRIGRVNRVDTNFDKIHSFNFFPTEQSNTQIKLKEAAEAKIQAFISLLGADACLLTDGEVIESHELFNRLASKKTITGEDEDEISELKYLKIIRTIRDENPDLFELVKRLPKKSRTSKSYKRLENCLLTYFRKGKVQKFFITSESESSELDFLNAALLLESEPHEPRKKLPNDFYIKLDKNKQEFRNATSEEIIDLKSAKGGRDSGSQVLKILKAFKDFRQFTDEDETYFKRVMNRLENGALPKQTSKNLLKKIKEELKQGDPKTLKILAILQNNIPESLLVDHFAENRSFLSGKREVILSEYLLGE